MEQIHSKIREFLETKPGDSQLTDFINNLQPPIKPTLRFCQLAPNQLQQPTPVYIHLMVQDIRQSYFYYSFLMKRPFDPKGDYLLYKFGNRQLHQKETSMGSPQDDNNFIKVMSDRESLICLPPRYQTKWVHQLEGSKYTDEPVEMVVDGRTEYKLGEIFHAVAIYYPKDRMLYFVRKVTQEQVKEEKLDPLADLTCPQSQLLAARKQLLQFFSLYSEEIFSHFLLFSLISQKPLFLGCDQNWSALISQIYPRVSNIKVKHPFKQSLFPYKNEKSEEEELICTPLQLTNAPTFVVIDFSELSSDETIKITQEEIDNISALRVFVGEEQTIYRWLIGESRYDHKHSGLIIKAAKIIPPNFVLTGKNRPLPLEALTSLPEKSKQRFREYLQTVRRLSPLLNNEERLKVENDLKNQGHKLGKSLETVMRISKYVAQSKGKQVIEVEDYEEGKRIASLLSQ